jgi:hypothetical protein
MSPRAFIALAAVTAFMVAAAVVVQVTTFHRAEVVTVDRPALPGLRDRLDDVARIEIAFADGEIMLERNDAGRWIYPEIYDYPADAGRIGELLATLADMQLREAKTSNPDLFERLDLRPVDSDEAESDLVTLEDGEGETIASLLVGKRRFNAFGPGKGGTYVRDPGTEQAWLADRELRIEEDRKLWLDRGIVDMDTDDVRTVTITHPDGETLRVFRDSEDQENPSVADLPADAELSSPDAARPVTTALALLELDAVEPAAGFDWPAEGVTRAVYSGFDGLQVTVELFQRDEKYWARVEAAVAGDADELAPEAREAIEARVAKINERTSDWVYQLPPYKGDRMDTRMSELLKDPDAS